ncbi:hypothetical protein XELAEV_18017061mg [Xenopus laevis]|uniref:Uncharacterized protein n=1 Tax=Xenopus laevis TaxID=8355 RepID=A0A974HSB7_XENLA|nr:hypothetical protein XELAEV_18017061mg [Xenopus laevis]
MKMKFCWHLKGSERLQQSYFLQALATKTVRLEKTETDFRLLKDKSLLTTECMRNTADRAGALDEKCTFLKTMFGDAVRKKTDYSPVTNTKIMVVIMSTNGNSENGLKTDRGIFIKE